MLTQVLLTLSPNSIRFSLAMDSITEQVTELPNMPVNEKLRDFYQQALSLLIGICHASNQDMQRQSGEFLQSMGFFEGVQQDNSGAASARQNLGSSSGNKTGPSTR